MPQEHEPGNLRAPSSRRDRAQPNSDADARRATGITNHPRGDEADQQGQLPPRGAKKGEAPAPQDDDDIEGFAFAQLIRELQDERDRRLAELSRREQTARSLSRDLEEPRDTADEGSLEHDTDRLEQLAGDAARRVDALQRALDRAAQGRLTICDQCGGPIRVERLRADPETSLCIRCAREREANA